LYDPVGVDYDNYDYLYGEDAPLTSNPATIKMKHLMAKVTVNVTTGTDIDAGEISHRATAIGCYNIAAEFASADMAVLLNGDQTDVPWEYIEGNAAPTLKFFNKN